MNEQLPKPGVPDSQDATGVHHAFGTPIQSFRASPWARIIIIACGIAMFLTGTIVIIAENAGSIDFTAWLIVWGPVLCLCGYLLGRQRLLICPGGVVRIRGRAQEQCRWDEIGEIVVACDETQNMRSRRLSLAKRDGSRFDVLDLNVGQFSLLVNTMRRMAELHGISWKDTVARGQRGNWKDWLMYGLIGWGIIMLIVVGVLLSTN